MSYDVPVENNQIHIKLQKQEVPTERWLYFDETGKIIRQETYEQGKLKDTVEF